MGMAPPNASTANSNKAATCTRARRILFGAQNWSPAMERLAAPNRLRTRLAPLPKPPPLLVVPQRAPFSPARRAHSVAVSLRGSECTTARERKRRRSVPNCWH